MKQNAKQFNIMKGGKDNEEIFEILKHQDCIHTSDHVDLIRNRHEIPNFLMEHVGMCMIDIYNYGVINGKREERIKRKRKIDNQSGMKAKMIENIISLMNETNDIILLDLIYKILKKSNKKAANPNDQVKEAAF